jgi:tripartite-type tricarboxylate transporter receptor subunit TctC
VQQLSTELIRMFQLQETKDRLTPLGVEITTKSATELRSVIAADLAKWRKVVADAGIRPE